LRAETVEMRVLQGRELTLHFEQGLEGAAQEVAAQFPQIGDDLKARFGWEIRVRPTVMLIKTPRVFQRMAGSVLIVAYALPRDNLIVMDYSRPALHRQRRGNVFKHELVHLLLHQHIQHAQIPRWFDEGVAQWASEGVAELLEADDGALLEQALLSRKNIPFQNLVVHFPDQRQALALAYAQSRSLVAYIADQYGAAKILQILGRMKTGEKFERAFESSLGVSPAAVERHWIDARRTGITWLTYLAAHIYEFIFLAAALMTVFGFVRFLIRKRAYRDEPE
jgi:hypothetical protein